MKIERFSICNPPAQWTMKSNELIDTAFESIEIYTGDSGPTTVSVNIWIISSIATTDYYSNLIDYSSGTTLIKTNNEWRPPDDVNESAFILCDDLFADRITLQGNTQFGYKQFSNITIKRE